uniref:Interleukin-6 n=1 Tax=Neogobius melanostomus TaxID=47308 RepID=A0A8C6SIF7_9GOBI
MASETSQYISVVIYLVIHSFIHSFKTLWLTGAALLMVLMLAALDISVGAPVDFPTEEPSGAGAEGGSHLLSKNPLWKSLLDATHRHEQEAEFPDLNPDLHLENFNISSLPEDCRNASINMEGCLRRLAQGLLVYQVLLRHVEQEYPLSKVLPNAKHFSGPLITATKEKPGGHTAEGSESLRHFSQKMFAHNILRKLHEFLRDTHIDIREREMRLRGGPLMLRGH